MQHAQQPLTATTGNKPRIGTRKPAPHAQGLSTIVLHRRIPVMPVEIAQIVIPIALMAFCLCVATGGLG